MILNGAKTEKVRSEANETKYDTYYSSSSSLGKFTVQSSSLRQMGLPRRMDIDLSAGIGIENDKRGDADVLCHTSKQQPEGSAPYFAFYEVQTFIRGFFVHAKRDGNMRRLSECSVLRGIMSFAEVINTIAREEWSWLRVDCERRMALTSNE